MKNSIDFQLQQRIMEPQAMQLPSLVTWTMNDKWRTKVEVKELHFESLDNGMYGETHNVDMLKSKGKITVRNPKNSQKLKYEKKENFYQFHQRLGHPNGEVSRCDREDPRVDQ